jgi:serine protease Do
MSILLCAPLLLATSADDPLDELRDLARFQTRIDAVLAAAVPATVGIRTSTNSGSGVIVSADGLVLTAGHVIGRAGREATIVLHDGTELLADTLGLNEFRDSGMLRIRDAHDLPHVTLPLPTELAPGDWCLAIGHPGGPQAGRPPVPRLGRIDSAGGQFVRTDSPVIHGDSGGPLFDLDGHLIGIHSRIEQDVASNYHVPMSTYRLGWARLVDGEEWTRSPARLGVMRLEDARPGARIGRVIAERAAARAGLQDGDVVLRLEGEAVDDGQQLRRYLGDLLPDATVRLEVLRGTERVTLEVQLGDADEGRPAPEEDGRAPVRMPAPRAAPAPGSAALHERNAPDVLAVFAPVVRPVSPSVATLRADGRAVAFATAVSAEGLFVSKASELSGELVAHLPDGRALPARLLAQDPNYDLALLEVEAHDLTPVTWSAAAPRVGRLVVSADAEGAPLAVGIVGVAPQLIAGRRARLGVVLAFGTEGAVVAEVTPGSPATLAGILAGDRIVEIDGAPVASRAEAARAIRAHAAGETLPMRVARGDEELAVEPILSVRDGVSSSGRSTGMDGARSDLRTGFPSALQHDTVVRPDQVGGPLVTLDGAVTALNIARAGRVATYAIPADAVQRLLARWQGAEHASPVSTGR